MYPDICAWFILVLTYGLALLFIKKSKIVVANKILLIAILFFVLSLHHLVAIYNYYISATPLADSDALTFHKLATAIAQGHAPAKFGSGPIFYRLMLATTYMIFGVSRFLGNELSVFAFIISCFIFIKIYALLGYNKFLPMLLLIFGTLPTMVFIGSVTLRESWQILFLMLTIYFCFKCLFANNLYDWVGYIASGVLFSLFHEGFVIFVFLLTGMMILVQGYKSLTAKMPSDRKNRIRFMMLTISLVGIAIAGLNFVMNKAPELEPYYTFINGTGLKYIQGYRARGLAFEARTNFSSLLDTSSWSHMLLSSGPVFLQFMFAPFPWQISNFMDLYASLEGVIRLLLMMAAIIACYFTPKEKRQPLIFLVLVYLMLSFLWALGTLNYGTSMRHHVVGYWLLILLLGAFLQSVSYRKNIQS